MSAAIDEAIVEQEVAVVAEVNATVAEARAIVVNTPDEAQGAVEFLARIAAAKKRSEQARRYIVDPLNAHVKAINERFKRNAEPLDDADKLVREKLLAFQEQEQARLAAEQARLDEERREQERVAEERRRAEAAEAERVEREAREAEAKRQAELREAANERAREIAAMSTVDLLNALGAGTLSEGDTELAKAEVDSRRAATEAQQRAEEARTRAEQAQAEQIAVASAPAAQAVATPLKSASGSASTRKRWVATVEDPTRIPREYLAVDQKAINAAVREGVREIPGVRIEQVSELAVRG